MKSLYVWNWVGGGYNQTVAESSEDAIWFAENKMWPGGPKVDQKTLKKLNGEEEKEYWKNFPFFD